jgi:hypothetical protein
VTTYAVNAATGDLIATWPVGVGVAAKTIGTLGVGPFQIVRGSERRRMVMALCANLNHLSTAVWKTYTHDGDRHRDGLDEVLTLIAAPPRAQASSAISEAASRIGRLLGDLDDAGLRAAVTAAVAEELDAVSSASMGDLSGLAQQALTMSRCSSSPVQVQAAWRLLDANPLDAFFDTLATLDPTSAAVAAAEWLRHAALEATDIASEDAVRDPRWVYAVQAADDIQPMPSDTATEVLYHLDAGYTAREVVENMVRDAMAASEGRLPDMDFVDEQTEKIERFGAQRYAEGFDPTADVDFLTSRIRVCRLDPTRPALDLLEDLHVGLWGCFLLWNATTDPTAHADDHADDRIPGDRSEEFASRVRARAALVDHLSL